MDLWRFLDKYGRDKVTEHLGQIGLCLVQHLKHIWTGAIQMDISSDVIRRLNTRDEIQICRLIYIEQPQN